MRLTREEEEMLAGKRGYPVQKSMEILVQLGEIYGAEKMIKVANVHMPGSSVVVAGEAGTKFVEKMAGLGGKVCALTTLNPGAVNFDAWQETGYEEKTYKLQRRLTDAYSAMGAVPCHTCTPYLIGNCPRRGEHISWGESSAIAFANSALGAYTNREGGPSALAAALTGRVPEYGYHLQENRYGHIKVTVTTELHSVDDFGGVGLLGGNHCRQQSSGLYRYCRDQCRPDQGAGRGPGIVGSGGFVPRGGNHPGGPDPAKLPLADASRSRSWSSGPTNCAKPGAG